MYEARDLLPGQQMVGCFKPFLRHLLSLNLSAKTLRKHRDNLWLLGGEIISDLHESPRLRKRPMAQVVFAALNDEGGPLISNRASEEQQRSFDFDLSQTPSLPQRRWVLRLTGCGHVDNASALPTGSTAHNSRHRRLLPHQFEARKPEYPPQFGRTRSRIVSETPTDSSEEAHKEERRTLVRGGGQSYRGRNRVDGARA